MLGMGHQSTRCSKLLLLEKPLLHLPFFSMVHCICLLL
jgi:hypothetical protein